MLGWLSEVPVRDRNPRTLTCSAGAFPGQAWIHDQIPVLLGYYAAHWQGAYNHGTQQDLELLRAGCAYPAGAWGGQPLRWREQARRQMIESFGPGQYGPVVDAQGATNEQATGYANFTFGLWTTAERDLAACGYSLPGWITSRIAQMPMFLALATQPDGKLAQIGDTYVISPRDRAGTPLQYAATMGAAGSAPARRIGVYSAGYILGQGQSGQRQCGVVVAAQHQAVEPVVVGAGQRGSAGRVFPGLVGEPPGQLGGLLLRGQGGVDVEDRPVIALGVADRVVDLDAALFEHSLREIRSGVAAGAPGGPGQHGVRVAADRPELAAGMLDAQVRIIE